MSIILSHSGTPKSKSTMLLKQCPATSGLPLLTTEKGFTSRCKKEQEKDDNPNRPGYCRAVCKGKIWLEELTILKLEDMESDTHRGLQVET
jgi:hypothetical protein